MDRNYTAIALMYVNESTLGSQPISLNNLFRSEKKNHHSASIIVKEKRIYCQSFTGFFLSLPIFIYRPGRSSAIYYIHMYSDATTSLCDGDLLVSLPP
jgi:hypothetical protein